MGHNTRLEIAERDTEYKSIGNENARIVSQVQALMTRMLSLYNDADATAEDKSDLIALRQKLIDDLTAAVALP